VNDAPALKQADIGIAMGIRGTDVTKEASDMVLADDNFATIVRAVELGRWIFDNIKKYLAFLLQCNLVEIIVISTCVLAGFPLPLLPAAILYINLATDGLPAIALGISPADPDIMQRPPRDPEESVFSKDLKLFLTRALVVEAPLLFLLFLFSLQDSIDVARTRLFLGFVFFELVVALNCRSLKYPIDKVRPHKILVLTVLWEVALLSILIYIPAVRNALGIRFPTALDLGLVLILCALTFASIEALKRWEV